MVSVHDDDPVSLLIIGGIFRDDFPWLSELMTESYREIRDEGPEKAAKVAIRLRRVAKMFDHGLFQELMINGSSESHEMAMEVPIMINHVLLRQLGRAPLPEANKEEPDDE